MDMSRGGARAVFMEEIDTCPEDDFLIRFVNAAGKVIAPEFRWGKILRAEYVRSDCIVALKFQRPLAHEVLHRLLSADLGPTRRAPA